MNKQVLEHLKRKMRASHEDHNDSRDSRDMRDMRDYADSRRDRRDERGDMNPHASAHYQQGGDRRDYRDSRDYRDYNDDYADQRDYGGNPMRLSKSDIKEWKRRLENADGSRGEHFDEDRIFQAAEIVGVKFRDYDEREFCLAVNVMYSDYCKVVKKYVSPEKELMFYCEMAKAFLEDPDAPEPSEKLALYFHCIADN